MNIYYIVKRHLDEKPTVIHMEASDPAEVLMKLAAHHKEALEEMGPSLMDEYDGVFDIRILSEKQFLAENFGETYISIWKD